MTEWVTEWLLLIWWSSYGGGGGPFGNHQCWTLSYHFLKKNKRSSTALVIILSFFFSFFELSAAIQQQLFFFCFFFWRNHLHLCLQCINENEVSRLICFFCFVFFKKEIYKDARAPHTHQHSSPIYVNSSWVKNEKFFFFLNHILIRSSVALRERESLINSLFYLFLKKRSIATAAPHVIVGEYDPIRLFCCCTKKHLTLYYQSASSWSWILKWWWSIRIEISAAAAAAWPRDYIQWIHKG